MHHQELMYVDIWWYLLMCLWIATSCRFSGVQIAREPIVVGSRRFPTFGHLKSLQWHGDMTIFQSNWKETTHVSDVSCIRYFFFFWQIQIVGNIIQIDLSMVIFEVSLLPGWLGEWSASRCATSRAHGPVWTLRNPKDDGDMNSKHMKSYETIHHSNRLTSKDQNAASDTVVWWVLNIL